MLFEGFPYFDRFTVLKKRQKFGETYFEENYTVPKKTHNWVNLTLIGVIQYPKRVKIEWTLVSWVLYSAQKSNEFWASFFIPVKNICGFASSVTQHFRVRNESKKLLHHLIAQYLNLIMFNGLTKILKIKQVQN